MAIVQKIRDLFVQSEPAAEEMVVPAPPTGYRVRPLTEDHLREVTLLNQRCFKQGENYSKYTFRYLLTEPSVLGYRGVTDEGLMVGFIFIVANTDRLGHITTIGVAPEHRNRGVARMMLSHAEKALGEKGFNSLVLEVRVSNLAAQNLYSDAGFVTMQRLSGYYNNGEDAFLMSKVIR